MKSSKSLIVIMLSLVLLLAGAGTAYSLLSDRASEKNGGTEALYSKLSREKITVPDFTVYDREGNEVKLSDMKGRPVVVNFWTSWCYACTKELPAFEEVYSEYKDDVVFMMINKFDGNRENTVSLANFLNEKGYTFPVYLDTTKEAYINMRVYGIPMTFFIDAEGNQTAHASGELTREELISGIEMILQ